MVLSRWLATFRQNFRFRLFVQFTILTAIMTAAFSTFYVSHEIHSYRSQMRREAQLLAEQLAYNAKLPLFAEDRQALANLLSSVAERSRVSTLAIANAEGTIMASLGMRQPGEDDIAQTVPILAGNDSLSPDALLGGN